MSKIIKMKYKSKETLDVILMILLFIGLSVGLIAFMCNS